MAINATAVATTSGLEDAASSRIAQSACTHALRRRLIERREEIGRLRILIATESTFQYGVLRRLFKKAGGQTVRVTNSEQTLDALETMRFTLAVIDDCGHGIDGSWILKMGRWCSVMAGRAAMPTMLLCNSEDSARQLNREHGDVVAIESNATKILQTLASLGLLNRGE